MNLLIENFESICIAIFMPALLVIVGLNNYLFFHTGVEIFCIVISIVIFATSVRTFRYSRNSFTLFLGYIYFFMGVLTFFHLTTYYGINIFKIDSPNIATQFWIASKYFQALALLIAATFITTPIKKIPAFLVMLTTTAIIIISIMLTEVFPTSFIAGRGLTPFNIISKYVICFVLILSMITLHRNKNCIDGPCYRPVILSIIFTILAELTFTLYKGSYQFPNMAGYLLTMAAYYSVYWCVFSKGVVIPYHKLEISYDKTIEGWSKALELRDAETKGHSDRVVKATIELAKAYGIEEDKLVHIRRGALLHDIGKIGIPDSILFKHGKLTDEEWKVMHKHPEYAYELLSTSPYLIPAIDIPYYHHEKWDGSGYPCRLSGKDIPIAARIFAIVDVWDALSSDRPYRKAWTKEQIIDYIKSLSGIHFDPEIVKLFLEKIYEE
ncbi:MASE3 domain-containing protein [Clostridium magnum]|uniref:Cyclic di-GMP phosphodiesterase response regulator RpfG n=1 Tax=Clostridium magnum DSM 2767 TaxID=1121326 RepID=A0A162T8X0_9CLOT|nr:MASE3 domain-containing protein [Clostridium magnum]KZL92363.1 cyclic di-GMP phosphodiesterase response regulator RpfG [Clostridium magnum DSM 2767]SHH12024.1 HD domain-containing protein [Clostridium magnum DSM 2767]